MTGTETIFARGFAALFLASSVSVAAVAGDPRPGFRHEAPTELLVHRVTGPYSRHAEVLQTVLKRASDLGLPPTDIVTIYRSDPATTEPDALRWDLGVVLPDGIDTDPGNFFERLTLPEQEVAFIETDLSAMPAASHAVDARIAAAGFRQTGPTRVVWRRDSEAATEPETVELVKPVGPAGAQP